MQKKRKPTYGGPVKGNPRTARQKRLMRQKQNKGGMITQRPMPDGNGLVPSPPPEPRKAPDWWKKWQIDNVRREREPAGNPKKPTQPGGTPKTETPVKGPALPTPKPPGNETPGKPPPGFHDGPKPPPSEGRSTRAWWD